MFWLWPVCPVTSAKPAPKREGQQARALVAHDASAPARNVLAGGASALSFGMLAASRETLMRNTTALSRAFEGLRRVFARFRAALVHERWMHSAFGWALSPAQRLLPSTAWAFVAPAPAPRRAHGPLDGPFAVATTLADAGFAVWRGALAATPRLLPPPQWPLLPPPSQARNAANVTTPAATAMAWFAPMFGLAAGLGAWMPAAPGVLF